MGGDPPPPKGHAWLPIKITLTGDVDPEHVGARVADTFELRLGLALDATAELGAPRLGTIDLRFTGAPLAADDKAKLDRAVVAGIDRSVKRAGVAAAARGRGATATATAKPPAKRSATRSAPQINTWYSFAQAGDDEYQYALAQALGDRFGDASGIPHVYGVLYRLAGVPNAQLSIVVAGRGYTYHWALTRPVFTAKTDAPASVDAGTGEFTLTHQPNGADRYREIAIDHALGLLAKQAVDDARAKHAAPVERAASPDARLGEHRADAARLVDAYMTAHAAAFANLYRLGDSHSFILLPLQFDPAALLGGATAIDVVALVRPVTADEADALADEADELGGDSLLAQVPGGGSSAGGQGTGTGTGDGDGAGDGSGADVTGESGGAGGRGIAIAPAYDPRASIYPGGPPIPGAKRYELTCEPYDGEPSIDELGAAGQQMRQLIAEIAARLDMPTCKYPAHFCLSAFAMIDVRRTQIVAQFARDTSGTFSEPLVVAGRDSSGVYGFRPEPSVPVQILRHLAGTVPRIRRLYQLVHDHTWPRMSNAWFYGLAQRIGDAGVQACGTMYLYGCQIALDQLLHASKVGVEERQNRGQAYIDMFATLVRAQLADHVELILLSNALSSFKDTVGERHGQTALEYYRAFQRIGLGLALAEPGSAVNEQLQRVATVVYGDGDDRALAIQLADQTNYLFGRVLTHAAEDIRGGQLPSLPHAGEIAERDDLTWTIADSKGHVWTLSELQHMIAVQQQVVIGIDPLIAQIANNFVDAIRPLVDGTGDINAFVTDLLSKMLEKNNAVTADNRADATYAFDHGQIHRVDEKEPALRIPTVQGGRFVLTGIHALGHQLVGEAFDEDPFYTDALDHLLGHADAVKALRDDLLFFGTIVLSVICPPLGAAVGVIGGIAIGIHDYHHAKEQAEIYGALLDPDRVLSYAEIQVELLVAKIGIAMSFLAAIPEVGSALKGVSAAAKGLAAEGVEVSARALARGAVERQLAHLAEVTAEKFVFGVARELAQAAVMNKVFEAVLTPFIEGEIDALVNELDDQKGIHADDGNQDGR